MAIILTTALEGLDKVRNGLAELSGSVEGVSKKVDAQATAFGTASTALGGFGKVLGALGIAVTAGSMVKLAKDTIDYADDLNDMSMRTGVAVETLSSLKLAAENSGTSLGAIAQGFKFLNRDIAEGGKKLGEFGISLADKAGNVKSTEQVFLDVADAISRMDDPAQRTALAMDVFGRSGTDLIPMLMEGKKGLQGMMQAARETGNVITTEAAAGADTFNDSLGLLKSAMSGLLIGAITPLMKPLGALIKYFAEAFAHSEALKLVLGSLKIIFKILATGIIAVITAFEALYTSAKTVVKVMADIAQLKFADALKSIKEGGVDVAGSLTRAKDALKGIWVEEQKATEETKKFASGVQKSTKDASKAFETLYDNTVGHSYIPDLVRGVAQWMGPKLRAALVDETKRNTTAAAREFETLSGAMTASLRGGYSATLADAGWWGDQLVERVRDVSDLAADSWNTFSSGFSKAVADIIVEGGSLRDKLSDIFSSIAKGFIEQIVRMTTEWLAFRALTAAGIIVPGIGGAMGGGALAAGGAAGVNAVTGGTLGGGALAAGGGAGVEAVTGGTIGGGAASGAAGAAGVAGAPALAVAAGVLIGGGAVVGAVSGAYESLFGNRREEKEQRRESIWAAMTPLGRELNTEIGQYQAALQGVQKAVGMASSTDIHTAKKRLRGPEFDPRDTAGFGLFSDDIKASKYLQQLREYFASIDSIEELAPRLKGMNRFTDYANFPRVLRGAVNKQFADVQQSGGDLGPAYREWAVGGSMLATSPKLFMAGERGAERVDVYPAGQTAAMRGNGEGNRYTFNGPVLMTISPCAISR